MQEKYLVGRRALVTAASRNLGAAIATALARKGAAVCVQYHQSADASEDLVQRLRAETGLEHIAVRGDATDSHSIRQVVGEASERLGGPIDVLVNNFGPFSMTPYAELPESEWDRIFDANAKACYVATQCVAVGMRKAGWGRIVNLAAGSAYLRNHSIYGLAKEAIIFLTIPLSYRGLSSTPQPAGWLHEVRLPNWSPFYAAPHSTWSRGSPWRWTEVGGYNASDESQYGVIPSAGRLLTAVTV